MLLVDPRCQAAAVSVRGGTAAVGCMMCVQHYGESTVLDRVM
jgi:hypothetical protein